MQLETLQRLHRGVAERGHVPRGLLQGCNGLAPIEKRERFRRVEPKLGVSGLDCF